MHAGRKSCILFGMDPVSHEFAADSSPSQMSDWTPEMHLMYEFSTAKIARDEADEFMMHCKTTDECMFRIYEMGFGPVPMNVDRSGILLYMPVDPR